MPQTINTNINSLNAQRNLNGSQQSLAVSMQRLSSGLRVNSAKDDAAGLAIDDDGDFAGLSCRGRRRLLCHETLLLCLGPTAPRPRDVEQHQGCHHLRLLRVPGNAVRGSGASR